MAILTLVNTAILYASNGVICSKCNYTLDNWNSHRIGRIFRYEGPSFRHIEDIYRWQLLRHVVPCCDKHYRGVPCGQTLMWRLPQEAVCGRIPSDLITEPRSGIA